MDYGIKVTPTGVSAISATPQQSILNTRYPFHKLDITNPSSFQNILITFTKDTPNPVNSGIIGQGSFSRTQVYQFAHGYNYVPATWMFALNDVQYPDLSFIPSYQNGNLILMSFVSGSTGGGTQVALSIQVDKTNVTFYVIKLMYPDNFGNIPSPIANITGLTAKIRLYVFAEDIGI